MYKYIDEKKEHLHTYDGKALIGTSTVTKIIAKNLTWWSSGKALEQLGWTNPKLVPKEEGIKIAGKARKFMFINNEDYYDWLQECYRNHDIFKKEAGNKGTDRHALLEEYVKVCINENGGVPITVEDGQGLMKWKPIAPFMDWAMINIKKFLWSEIYCYSLELWTGGIGDVGWESNEGKIVAGDFKSSKVPYLDHWVQIGGYDLEISENGGYTAEGEKIFTLPKPVDAYCVIPFGAEKFEPIFRYNVEEYKNGFKAALLLHKLNQ